MKVILLADLGKHGKEGQTKEVKDGYARNYLIPRKLALPVNAASLKRFEDIKRTKEKTAQVQKEQSLKLKQEIEKISLTIACEAKENEELYGSVTDSQISRLLENEGIDVARNKFTIDEPIRKIGVYNLKLSLHPEVEAIVRLWVVKK